MSESTVQLPEVKLALGGLPEVRLFRNQVGLAYVGEPPNLRRVYTGLYPGSSDLIGWCEKVMTPEDVGKKFAIFMSVEVKAGKNKPKPHQVKWLQAVEKAGGVAFWANSQTMALEQLRNWQTRPF